MMSGQTGERIVRWGSTLALIVSCINVGMAHLFSPHYAWACSAAAWGLIASAAWQVHREQRAEILLDEFDGDADE